MRVGTCTLDVVDRGSAPLSCESGDVTLGPNGTVLECGDGYQLLQGGSRIELRGAACDTFREDPAAEVRLLVGCEG